MWKIYQDKIIEINPRRNFTHILTTWNEEKSGSHHSKNLVTSYESVALNIIFIKTKYYFIPFIISSIPFVPYFLNDTESSIICFSYTFLFYEYNSQIIFMLKVYPV